MNTTVLLAIILVVACIVMATVVFARLWNHALKFMVNWRSPERDHAVTLLLVKKMSTLFYQGFWGFTYCIIGALYFTLSYNHAPAHMYMLPRFLLLFAIIGWAVSGAGEVIFQAWLARKLEIAVGKQDALEAERQATAVVVAREEGVVEGEDYPRTELEKEEDAGYA